MPQSVVTVDEPQTYLDTAVSSTPSTGPSTLVGASDDLQAILDAAVPGDVILLSPGVVYQGNFTISARGGGIAGEWITVMSNGTLPAEGTRVTADDATTMAYPILRSMNILPVIQTVQADPPASKWRFIGVEIDVDTSVTTASGTQQGLVVIGDSGSAQNSLSVVPSDFIFDRCYAHGHSQLDSRKAFAFNAARCALIDSTVLEIHSGFDAQAVTCSNGPGPHKITNNHLESSGEVIAYGGAPVWITDMVPEDIEIRHNLITKPLAWAGVWNTKNLIEFKTGRRVLIEGNVMSNSKCDGQAGFAFVLWSANATGVNGAAWSVTEHVTVRYNTISITSAGVSVIDRYDDTITLKTNHVAIHNNVFIGLNSADVQCNGRLFQVQGDVTNLSIEHNTGFSPNNSSIIWGLDLPLVNHVVRNNLMGGGDYQLFASPGGIGTAGWTAAAGAGSILLGNVIALAEQFGTSYPTGNFYPGTLAAIGLAGGASAAYSATSTLADLTLSPAGTYSGAGTDGTDPGADMPAVASTIAGVDDGTAGSGTGVVDPPAAVLTTLTLAPSALTVTAGATGAVNATAADQNGASFPLPTLSAATSDAGIATATVSGGIVTVTGVAQGTATITVTSGTVTSNGVVVTVNAAVTDGGGGVGPIKTHPVHPPKIRGPKAKTTLRYT